MRELENASKILKPGKAVGFDNVNNEMILCLMNTYPNVILKLFNTILLYGEVIPEWLIGIIVPIYKKGTKSDPNNYRGITLTSCFSKLFLSVLYSRLMKFVIEKGILHNNQLGFVPGNRTSDAHIIINHLINKECHKNKSKIYSCFVDFSTAFDSIPRDILLSKLLSQNITGNFFNIIRHIYSNDQACVRIGNLCTETFRIGRGVRQGCILSPLLFNIFLSDLLEKIDLAEGKLSVGNTEISCVAWADDLVLLSNSEEGLQKMLKTLELYCCENKLQINTDKTKCMIFNKGGRLMRRNFQINGIPIENVRTFKYLGFVLTPSGEINSGLKDLRDRAFKGFMKLKSSLGNTFRQDISITLDLIHSMIKPILLYMSDFWGCLKLPKSNPIENLQMMMCKQILGVQRQTTNIGVQLELGQVPLSYHAVKLAVKNWERIRQRKANSLVLECYKEASLENSPWISSIKRYLEMNGMLCFFVQEYENKPFFIHKKLFQKLSDQFHQGSFEQINKEESKLRTYGVFKNKIGMEKYLLTIKNPKIRSKVSKFRLSNHDLMIETGRHKGMPKELRFCNFCPNTVETETHFLLHCHAYKTLRDKLLTHTNPNFEYYTEQHKLQALLTDMDYSVAKYIANSLDLRQFLINKHKMPI